MIKKIMVIVLLSAILLIENFSSNSIITKQKELYLSNTNEVSHKEMAMASALSYLPIPIACKNWDGSIKANCKFSDRNDLVDGLNAYINLHNYATPMDMDAWTIVDYTEKSTSEIVDTTLVKAFNAYTLKKGNNIIVVFRGTDFVDVAEWIQHISYAATNIHDQEAYAEEYILKQAKKYKNCNIYITGHSLGGYLAQIAASTLSKAISNGKTGTTDWNGWNLRNKYDINDYLTNGSFSEYKNIKLEQAVSLNGMGLLFDSVIQEGSVLEGYQGTKANYQNSKIEQLKKLKNEKNKNGESKIISYNVKGDIVSSLGIHYGEVREIMPSIDSVAYHKKNYVLLSGANSLIVDSASYLTKYLNIFEYLEKLNSKIKLNRFIKNELLSAYNEYATGSLVAHVTLAHEADTFVCLLDGSEIPELKIVKETNGFISSQYEYITQGEINEIISNKPVKVTLRAMTSGACARKYIWYECNDEKCTKPVQKFTSSKINTYTVNVTDSVKYYKVVAEYNDSYLKQEIQGKDGYFSYKSDNNRTEHLKGVVESKIIKVVSDTKPPKCSFNISNYTNTTGCKKTVVLNCTDNFGLQNSKIKESNFSGALKNNLYIIINDEDRNSLKKQIAIPITLKSKMITIGSQNLKVSVKDYVGNTASATLKSDIDLGLFRKKCN